MSLTSAAGLASILSLVLYVIITVWYVVPWLAAKTRSEALAPLLWVHIPRYIALQIFSAQKFGFAVSNEARDQIAAGDVAGMMLAVISLVLLRYRPRLAFVVIWVLVVETILDLSNATIAGIREGLFETASGVTWLILNFYVPLLWVSVALIIWQLCLPRPKAMA